MSLAGLRDRIPVVNSWLLTATFFFIPIQVAPAHVLSAMMLLLLSLQRDVGQRLLETAREPLVWMVLTVYAFLLVSLLWSSDLQWGRDLIGRHKFFLLFPLYFAVARPEHFGRYVAAFLASIAFCEALAFYNWIQLHVWPELPEGIRVRKDPADTAPFVDRIFYTPILAFAGYLAGHRVLFGTLAWRWRMVYAALLVATTFNLIIAGGRAGLIGFLVMLVLLAFQRLGRRPLVASSVAATMVAALVLGGYHGNDYFKSRVDDGIETLVHYEQHPESSASLRLVYVKNALRIVSEHPLLGVGIGDYRSEYERVNAAHTPDWAPAWNPHNYYLFVLTAAGLPAGIALVVLLFYPLWRHSPADGRERMRRALPILMITICLLESYLLRSNVSLMCMLFTAALWRIAPASPASRVYHDRVGPSRPDAMRS